jgi:UDP-3-O-[3-hydroxymyristoyl] glucosamine N-acyltransferase
VMASQSGVAGSTTVGDRVVVGAQAGITGHIRVGDDITLTARTGVTKGLLKQGVFAGFPARPHRRWLKEAALQRGIPELTKRVRALEENQPDPVDS